MTGPVIPDPANRKQMRQLETHRGDRLQRAQVLPAQPIAIPLAPGASLGLKRDSSGVLEYWLMIRRHPGAVLLATVLGAVAGFLGTLSAPRIYQAHATVEILPLNDNFLNMKSLNPTSDGGSYSDIDIQTQVRILQSDSLIHGVVGKMVPPPSSQPMPLPDRLSAWRKALGIAPPTQEQLWKTALASASGGVRVRGTGLTRIVDLSCDSTSPALAANFINALADEYIEQNLEARWKATEHTGVWLTNQLRDLRVKLEKSQDELQEYARSTGLMVTAEKSNVDEAKLADLQKGLSVAQADRIAKQSTWEVASASPADSLPAILDDSSVQDTEKSLQDLRRSLAQLRITYTANHAEVRRVEAQIAALEAPLQKQRENILRRIRNEYDAALMREKLLTADYESQAHLVSGQTAEMDRYSFLKREVDATRTLYESMLQRLKEASIASALRASNIRVVDRAAVPGAPYKPDVSRSTLVGLLSGLCIGIAFAVFRERADRTIQDPGDAEYYLGVPELGVIPLGKLDEPMSEPAGDGDHAVGELNPAIEMMMFNARTSLLAESFRTTLTSILFSGRGSDQSRVLMVTSASPKEGKTTTVCNLAIAFAEVQSDVLVIDADMRRPRIHSVFNVDNGPGLSDLLASHTPLVWEDVEPLLQPTGVPNLKLLTSGQSRHKVTSLLYTSRLPELVELLRDHFDTAIFDTPPMVNIADARMIARHTDGVVMIIRSAKTTRDAAQLATQRLAEDGSTMLGVILNSWDATAPGYSYYKNYYAGYNHYYGNGNGNGSKSGKKKA